MLFEKDPPAATHNKGTRPPKLHSSLDSYSSKPPAFTACPHRVYAADVGTNPPQKSQQTKVCIQVESIKVRYVGVLRAKKPCESRKDDGPQPTISAAGRESNNGFRRRYHPRF